MANASYSVIRIVLFIDEAEFPFWALNKRESLQQCHRYSIFSIRICCLYRVIFPTPNHLVNEGTFLLKCYHWNYVSRDLSNEYLDIINRRVLHWWWLDLLINILHLRGDWLPPTFCSYLNTCLLWLYLHDYDNIMFSSCSHLLFNAQMR